MMTPFVWIRSCHSAQVAVTWSGYTLGDAALFVRVNDVESPVHLHVVGCHTSLQDLCGVCYWCLPTHMSIPLWTLYLLHCWHVDVSHDWFSIEVTWFIDSSSIIRHFQCVNASAFTLIWQHILYCAVPGNQGTLNILEGFYLDYWLGWLDYFDWQCEYGFLFGRSRSAARFATWFEAEAVARVRNDLPPFAWPEFGSIRCTMCILSEHWPQDPQAVLRYSWLSGHFCSERGQSAQHGE